MKSAYDVAVPIYILIPLTALVTACISGIFGMAGGMIFMGVIASLMGVVESMVLHGVVQSVSNSYRSFLLRDNIRWDVLRNVLIGAIPAIILLSLIRFIPNKGFLFLILGILPFLLWLPRGWMQGDAAVPSNAVACGFVVIAINLTAGVAGPALDFFFVKTQMTRKEIVSTKALMMFGSHIVKILYFGLPLLATQGLTTLPAPWIIGLAIIGVIIGTFTGTRILNRLSDINFRSYTKYIVTAVGIVYLFKAASLFGFF